MSLQTPATQSELPPATLGYLRFCECPLNTLKSNRLHGLDTLRALAIVAVMIFHLQQSLPAALAPIAAIGWTGVDLFFVLSGFLIGSQLLKPFAAGRRLDVKGFYLRRAFRILPAYLLVLGLYLAVPAWREQPRLPAAWKFLTFTANLIMVYPSQLAFSHAWSLCIEEHFYLVLPWLILWQMRKPSARKAAALIAAVVVFGIAIRSWELFHVVRAPGLSDDDVWPLFMKRIYYPTYSRLDGLLCGATLATLKLFRPLWWAKVAQRGWTLLFAGLAVSAAALWSFHWDYPSADLTFAILFGFPLLSLGFALLVAAALASNGPLRRRVPAASTLALLAYSLYLTHKEIAHLDRKLMPWMADNTGWAAAGVYALTCMVAAALLYLCVERPFLLLRDRLLDPATESRPDIEARLDPAL